MQSPLLTASTSTFESLTLVLPDAPPSDAQLAVPLAWGVRVAFAGPLGGTLEVRVSDDVARTLAANMLGVDDVDHLHQDDGPDRLVRDALGEVANVICGNLLPELAGRAAVFHLDAPQPVAVAVDAASPEAPLVTLGIDAGRAEVVLHLDAAPAAHAALPAAGADAPSPRLAVP